MVGPRSRVGDILLKAGILDTLQLRSALAHQERWGGRLTHAVLELGLADDAEMADALAKALGMQRLELAGITKEPTALARIPVAFSSKMRFVRRFTTTPPSPSLLDTASGLCRSIPFDRSSRSSGIALQF